MKMIEVKEVSKAFGQFQAISKVSFSIDKGKLVGLLGPSGGGKSTLLRMLAGLETPDSGDIIIDGVRVNDLPPQKRGIGFVFQNYALFRHMTVFDNIAFGLKVKKKSKAEIRERVQELLELTNLQGLDKRYPHQLSGGQRQRVAFARALAPGPELLLLDEPFAAMDAKVRKELRSWLKQLIQTIGVTSIFVTHDQDEAVEVADEMLIIQKGRLEQQGSPAEIYTSPKTAFVAEFIGQSTILDNPGKFKGFGHLDDGVKALIRPEFVEVGAKGEIQLASAVETGLVRHVYFRGAYLEVELDVRGSRVFAFRPLERRLIHPGEEVEVLIHRFYVLDGEETRLVENTLKREALSVVI